MLSPTYLKQLGVAKINQIRMMRDRGHALSDVEADMLRADDPALAIGTFTGQALATGCSLSEALSGTYVPAAIPTQGRLPDVTTVVFLDQQWEDAKRRGKMSSTDQVKSALDAARASSAFVASAVPNILIISPTPLTPDAKREIMDVGDVSMGGSGARIGECVRVQVMLLSDLYIPLQEHAMVPVHCRQTADQAATFCVTRNIHPTQLGIMPDLDAAAAYYDYRPNDIIAVTRPGSVEYRIVQREMS